MRFWDSLFLLCNMKCDREYVYDVSRYIMYNICRKIEVFVNFMYNYNHIECK